MGAHDPALPRVPRRLAVPVRAAPTSGTRAVISGPTPLHGAEITVPDLRGGFSYLIAALAAEGQSKVHGIELIYRGYERFSGQARRARRRLRGRLSLEPASADPLVVTDADDPAAGDLATHRRRGPAQPLTGTQVAQRAGREHLAR